MQVRSLNFSKVGNEPLETEDSLSIEIPHSRFAIADGASDSIFSGQWASSLSSVFTGNSYDLNSNKDLDNFLERSRDIWINSIEWNNLKWNVKNKAVKGAFSTFLGFTCFPEENVGHIYAVGDSCFFIFQDNGMMSFPLTKPSEFGIHPSLVWSGYGYPLEKKPYGKNVKIKLLDVEIKEGTRVIMATDALSKFIMESEEPIFELLWNHYQNREFFDEKRSDKSIKNDDLAAILISF